MSHLVPLLEFNHQWNIHDDKHDQSLVSIVVFEKIRDSWRASLCRVALNRKKIHSDSKNLSGRKNTGKLVIEM
jgi:hypothetical protein